jgi:lipoprotein-anchoring transpeptidase ErfK/SrfK
MPNHFSTSRHFIARSLNGKADYFTQKVSPGSKFNVFRKDKNFQFYLLVDVSRCQMDFYYLDQDTNERVLLKTYTVGLGKKAETPSGTLTPLGKYLLGDKIAVYKPGVMGLFQDKEVEMIRVFGTRWIPFGKELEGCTASAKGYGIHGAPWTPSQQEGRWTELRQMTGQYDSDGCIRLNHEDSEEIFSIIINKTYHDRDS